MCKKTNGITLIALVITIIVLLILAGVSISALMGDDGLIGRSREASLETRAAGVEEARDIWMQDRKLAIINNETPKSLDDILNELQGKDLLTEEEVETVLNSPDNSVTIGDRTISFCIIAKVEPEEISDWEWIDNEDGTITIVAYNGPDTEVVVPNYIEGLPVKKLEPKNPAMWTNGSIWGPNLCSGNYNDSGLWYTPKQNTITSVTISEGIEELGPFCFAGSHALIEIKLPNTLKKMDSNAFAACIALSSIEIPASLTEFDNVFIYSNNLSEINVADGNPVYLDVDGILFSKDKSSLLIYPAGKTEETYIIPENVTKIVRHSFANIPNLKNIFIPKTVTTVESVIFSYRNNATVHVEYTEAELPETWDSRWDSSGTMSGNNLKVVYGVTMPTN